MRATFRGFIHLYTGRSVDQLLVLKQEPKNRAGRSMREASMVGVRLRFIMLLLSLGPSQLSMFWAFRTFPVERGETQNRSLLTCSVTSKQIGKHFRRDKHGFLATNRLCLGWDVGICCFSSSDWTPIVACWQTGDSNECRSSGHLCTRLFQDFQFWVSQAK